MPSGTTSTVDRIVTMDGDLDVAVAGQSVTITLTDEIDASRGDLLCAAESPAEVADQFEGHVVWMHEDSMLPGRRYLMKIGTRTVGVTISHPKYRVDVNSLDHLAADTLELNEIGVCNIGLDRPIPFDAYGSNRDTGGFVIIDKLSNVTVGAGMIVDRTPADRALDRRRHAEDAGTNVSAHRSRITADSLRASHTRW